MSEFWTIVAAELFIMILGIGVWIFRPDFYARMLGRRAPKEQSTLIQEVKPPETIRSSISKAHLERQDERMRRVYAPLHSAVISMRQLEDDPLRRRTVGSPIHFWKEHPEIIQQVIEVFTLCPDLVENDRVWKGWADNESKLRDRDLWVGDTVYEWFDAIEEEYHRINSELKTSPSSEKLTQSIKQANSQETKIPPPFDTGKCPNCGSIWPVAPLSPLAENILRVGTLYYDEDLPRLVPCPKCGLPAPVTPQPKKKKS